MRFGSWRASIVRRSSYCRTLEGADHVGGERGTESDSLEASAMMSTELARASCPRQKKEAHICSMCYLVVFAFTRKFLGGWHFPSMPPRWCSLSSLSPSLQRGLVSEAMTAGRVLIRFPKEAESPRVAADDSPNPPASVDN